MRSRFEIPVFEIPVFEIPVFEVKLSSWYSLSISFNWRAIALLKKNTEVVVRKIKVNLHQISGKKILRTQVLESKANIKCSSKFWNSIFIKKTF